jgi:replicative DNA helicase
MQAEQALLGALLANNKAWNQVRDFLLPEHMADPVHGRILQAIMRRVEAGQLADAVTLKTDLENSGILEEVGGTKYLAQLLTAMVSPMLAGEYGRTIFDCWTRRKAIDLGTKFVNAAFGDDSDLTAADVIERHEDDIVALRAQSTASASRRRGPVTALDAFEELVAGFDDKRSNGVWSTGLTELDRIIGGGIAPDTLTYLIGDGGAGKTELCLQVGENVAMSLWDAWVAAGSVPPCPGVLYIMLGNMSRRQMIARTGARHSGVRLKTLRRG